MAVFAKVHQDGVVQLHVGVPTEVHAWQKLALDLDSEQKLTQLLVQDGGNQGLQALASAMYQLGLSQRPGVYQVEVIKKHI